MKCKDVMTKYIKMCRPESTMKDCLQIMKDLNCGAVPIVNENSVIQGIVTDRDIAIKGVLEGKNIERSQIQEIMTRNVITSHENDDIDHTIQLMKENKIRRIPIVDSQNKLKGIVSLGDIAVISKEEHEVFDAFETISSPVSGAK